MSELVRRVRFAAASGAQTLACDVLLEDSARGSWCLLCVHGFGDNLHTWQPLRSLLEPRGARVIALDLPGFGRSALPPEFRSGYTLHAIDLVHELARDVARTANQPLILAGNSLGAAIALGVALRDSLAEPAQRAVDGALLLAPPTQATRTPIFARVLRAPVYRWTERTAARLSPRGRRALASAVARTAIRMMVAPGFRAPRAWCDSVIESFARAGVWLDLETVAWDLLWILRGEAAGIGELFAHLEQISTPISIARGGHDRVISAREIADLTARLPAAKTVELADVGHLPQIEAPERCAEMALELLSRAREHHERCQHGALGRRGAGSASE